MSGPPDAWAVAVVPVRGGVPARGGDEAVAEAGGRCVLAGSGVRDAAAALTGIATDVLAWETATYAPRSLGRGPGAGGGRPPHRAAARLPGRP